MFPCNEKTFPIAGIDLRSRVTQKALQLPLNFFFCFSLVFMDRLVIGLYLGFYRFLQKTRATQYQDRFIGDTEDKFVTNIILLLVVMWPMTCHVLCLIHDNHHSQQLKKNKKQ